MMMNLENQMIRENMMMKWAISYSPGNHAPGKLGIKGDTVVFHKNPLFNPLVVLTWVLVVLWRIPAVTESMPLWCVFAGFAYLLLFPLCLLIPFGPSAQIPVSKICSVGTRKGSLFGFWQEITLIERHDTNKYLDKTWVFHLRESEYTTALVELLQTHATAFVSCAEDPAELPNAPKKGAAIFSSSFFILSQLAAWVWNFVILIIAIVSLSQGNVPNARPLTEYQGVTYKQLMQNTDFYMDKLVCVEGYIFNEIQSGDFGVLQISEEPGATDVVDAIHWLQYDLDVKPTPGGSYVVAYGIFKGRHTYETLGGVRRRCPLILAQAVEVSFLG